MMLAVSLAMIGLVSNCGGGGGGVVDVDPCSGSVSVSATEVELPVTCLKPATTYYWKVSVSDGIGTIESSIASFTTL